MKSEQDILAALRALADSDREKEAPPEVEVRLRQQFRRKRREKKWKRPAMWTLVAAAAGVVVIVASYASRTRVEQPLRVIATEQPRVVQPVVPPSVEVARVASKPARKAAHKRPAPQQEIVTEFFPLIDIAPPFERGELVRVNLPASAMRTVGLPVREDRLSDRVQADVLVGQEGLPRAIRFVKYSQ